MTLPLVLPLPSGLEPAQALERVESLGHACLLESANTESPQGRFSFLVASPFTTFRVARPRADVFAELAHLLQRFVAPTIPGLPPFQGGAAGFLGYELGRCFERIPAPFHDEFGFPLAWLGFYDVVLAWDHLASHSWLISQGWPEMDPRQRLVRAQQRATQFMRALSAPPSSRPNPALSLHGSAHGLTAPQFETRLGTGWIGNFDSLTFQKTVRRVIDYIEAGDIFQANVSQRLMRRAKCHPLDLYLTLRRVNPAPFAGYLDLGESQLVSASPERFLQVQNRIVHSRPIKGTRPRTGNASEDAKRAEELITSVKDRAENTMIVDLLRNDLSRVCDPESLAVPQWCEIESFSHVLHLVSAIEGELRPDANLTDLIAATFPGGSITGAPKVRAMEIISELEPTVRGPYCGSLGYLGFDGAMDLNILIRTIVCSHGWWQFQVGGGIVADSLPECEEEETWTKAHGLIAAIQQAPDAGWAKS